MDIHLSNVIPFPIAELDYSRSAVWGQHIDFNESHRNLVLSPSGAGKTTLLAIIYGLRRDFNGDVTINGKPVREMRYANWFNTRRNHLAITFQDMKLFNDFTAYENIQVKNQLTNYKTSDEVQSMMDVLEIGRFADKKVKYLSQGQRQRVAIIRSLCQPMDYLLLDEPFSHLDRDITKVCCNLIEQELDKQNAGMIITSLNEEYYFAYDTKYNL
jgi:ABC-type lipoprotein export system ATPase subunit